MIGISKLKNLLGWISNKIKLLLNKVKPEDTVYVVTMVTGFDFNKYVEKNVVESKWTVGIYNDYEKANRVLKNNVTDLWETIYTYGVIEEVQLNRLYSTFSTINTEWYKFDIPNNQYKPIQPPEDMDGPMGLWR